MTTLPVRLRWPFLGLVAAAAVAVPPAPADSPPDDPAKQKQIQELEKQLAELQGKLAELKKPAPAAAPPVAVEGTLPDDAAKAFAWRCVGPANMGGRVTALAVVESDPSTYFVATASGGLLKTTNNGTTFQHLFDKEATVSIGDVAVAASDPNVVWVGTGENNPRNSVSYGDGVYKSTDGGKTWANVGLKGTYQVGKVLIHPKDPNVVYVGALGRLYGPNDDRGVFKTEDGGKTWKKVCYVDANTGVVDMRMDPTDPNVVVAAFWDHKRDQYDGFFGTPPVPDAYGPVVTHGPGGGLYKTADGGKTWKKLTDPKLNNGLPTAKLGRIGLDYSRKTKGLLVAVIDTEKGGTGESAVYLGVTGEKGDGGAKLTDVTEDGPAAKAGLKAGDVVTAVDGAKVEDYEKFVEIAKAKKPGDKIKLAVKRAGKELTVEVTLGTRSGTAVNNPPAGPAAGSLPPVAGFTLGRGAGLVVQSVTADGPAAKAGIKTGDAIVSLDGKPVADAKDYAAVVAGKKAGETLKVAVKRDGKPLTVEVTLAANPRSGAVGGGGRTGGGAGQPGNPSGPTLPMPGGIVPQFAQEGAVKVQTVPAGSAAEAAGVKAGDEVTAVDGNEVSSFREFLSELRVGPRAENPRQPGEKVKVTFKRGDKTTELELALVDTVVPFGGGGGGVRRGADAARPFGLGLGGQQPNVQARQGKEGYQTGGVFVSKDNGETWARVNSFNPRPMYFSQIRVDPTDDNTLYVLGDTPTPLNRSTDGGKTFTNLTTARGVHADAHALWINPANARHLVIGCDGGFYASYDKGATWDHLNTLALGQFYHVAVDTRKPYRVYGGLQDNGSWGGPSHTLRRYGPINEDWVYVSGGDGFRCAVDPTDPDLVYAESQGGAMSRRNFRTGESAGIRPARKAGDEPLRFNWNTPFVLSHHNPSIFLCAAQYVFRSVKKGDDLKQISPELTRTKQGCVVALAESPRTPDVIWAGTDDGFVWVTKDGGANWTNVTANFASAGLPGPRHCASIEPGREKDGRAYVVFDAHRSDDDKPYVFATDDFGQTWKPITANLPAFGSTRVLREDAVNPNLLYLGTEFGAWVSANRGASWTRLGAGLPTVAVHEFAQPTTANELVAATHGRSVWVLDLTALRQMTPDALKADVTLFAPAPAVRWKLGVGGESPYSQTDRKFVGTNPARGATIEYRLGKKADKVAVKVVDVTGRTVRAFATAPSAAGVHRLQWDLSGPARRQATGGGRQIAGGQVQPGVYRVVLTVGDKEFTHPLAVELDPNAPKDLIATDSGGEEEEDEDDGDDEAVKEFEKLAGKPRRAVDD